VPARPSQQEQDSDEEDSAGVLAAVASAPGPPDPRDFPRVSAGSADVEDVTAFASPWRGDLGQEQEQEQQQHGPQDGHGMSASSTPASRSWPSRVLEAGKLGRSAGAGSDAEEEQQTMRLLSWGQNSYSELGHGDSSQRQTPQVVEFLQERQLVAKQVVAGNEHTAILTKDGRVFCVGYNDSGQCGVGHTNRVSSFQEVETLRDKNVVSLCSANGCEHILVITVDGDLYSFGYNSRGQLGHGMTTHISRPRLVEALSGRKVVTVSCSYHHTVLATSEDEVFAMGRNDFGQLGLGDTLDRPRPEQILSMPRGVVLSLAAGQYHSVFSIDGTGVFACGKNDYGQLGVSVNAGEPRYVPVPVLPPIGIGTIHTQGQGRGGNAQMQTEAAAGSQTASVSGDSRMDQIVQLSCGYYHTVALTSEGKLYSWGREDYGQLGSGSRVNRRRPQRITQIPENVIAAACGSYHTLLLTEDGSVFACGRNNHAQLGIESDSDAMVPMKVEALQGFRVTQIAAGFYHSVCLTGPPDASATPPASTLSADLRKMLNNEARSDVTFIVEGKPLYAHRAVIMARCEPFEAMLDGPMREANQREIHLKDQQYHVIHALLEFLYTDEVLGLDESVDLDFALDILAVADQFLVERLKSLCEIAIQKSISTENVAVMFKTADQRQASALRKRCFEYLIKNFGSVIGTEGFVNLPQNLLREVLLAAHERGVTVRPTKPTVG